jgi:hypothetical protein
MPPGSGKDTWELNGRADRRSIFNGDYLIHRPRKDVFRRAQKNQKPVAWSVFFDATRPDPRHVFYRYWSKTTRARGRRRTGASKTHSRPLQMERHDLLARTLKKLRKASPGVMSDHGFQPSSAASTSHSWFPGQQLHDLQVSRRPGQGANGLQDGIGTKTRALQVGLGALISIWPAISGASWRRKRPKP